MTNTTMPYGYYDRFDISKGYEKNLFVAGAGLQSAELNEIQDYATHQIQSIGNAMFHDGNVIKDAAIIVNPTTGVVTAEAGMIYIMGAVRGVAAASFTIPTVGNIAIGLYLQETVVTALDDLALRDPASGTRNYQQPGASRLKRQVVWGFIGDNQSGEFYPVYTVVDGVQISKISPPNVDPITQSIAKYDRDLSGGDYIVTGFSVTIQPDDNNKQNYSIAAGRARVNGYAVELSTSSRMVFDAQADEMYVDSEPYASTTLAAQRITLAQAPIANITKVGITSQKTATMTHGAYNGALDPLPDNSVLTLVSVVQGTTTYVAGTDYKLTAGKVDWSLTGAEPATGSTYSVTYQYMTSVVPTLVDATGLTVTGAVTGSLILVSYNFYLPRFDRIALASDGSFVWVKGVAAEWNPQPPAISNSLLPICTIAQTWDANRSIVNDGVRVVPMNDIVAMNERISYVLGLVAQQELTMGIHTREAGAKKGLFVDPFLDDSQRDAGTPQTAAVINGTLNLPILAVANNTVGDITSAKSLPAIQTVDLSQALKTSFMPVNPYMSFAVTPAVITLTPAIDVWTEVTTSWAAPVTNYVYDNHGWWWWWWGWYGWGWQTVSTATNTLSSTSTPAQTLRQIDIDFSISGFEANENLIVTTFDGITITPVAQ